ncbi:hypothetical protein BJX63DRAFT_274679 [Aspergillus granulosus]|uniref:Secreted protein n=1 Tax=Aspergillus granulosus TaxID=176169 RepID=A0ABR4HA24_9EURO
MAGMVKLGAHRWQPSMGCMCDFVWVAVPVAILVLLLHRVNSAAILPPPLCEERPCQGGIIVCTPSNTIYLGGGWSGKVCIIWLPLDAVSQLRLNPAREWRVAPVFLTGHFENCFFTFIFPLWAIEQYIRGIHPCCTALLLQCNLLVRKRFPSQRLQPNPRTSLTARSP